MTMIDVSMRLSIRSGRVEFLTALSLHALTAAACSSDSGSGPSLSEDVTPSTPAASVPTSPPVLAAAATAIVTSSDTLGSSATPGQAAGDAPATATSELDSIPDPVVAPTSVAQPTIAPTPDPSNTATPTPAPAPPPGPAATSTAVVRADPNARLCRPASGSRTDASTYRSNCNTLSRVNRYARTGANANCDSHPPATRRAGVQYRRVRALRHHRCRRNHDHLGQPGFRSPYRDLRRPGLTHQRI